MHGIVAAFSEDSTSNPESKNEEGEQAVGEQSPKSFSVSIPSLSNGGDATTLTLGRNKYKMNAYQKEKLAPTLIVASVGATTLAAMAWMAGTEMIRQWYFYPSITSGSPVYFASRQEHREHGNALLGGFVSGGVVSGL